MLAALLVLLSSQTPTEDVAVREKVRLHGEASGGVSVSPLGPAAHVHLELGVVVRDQEVVTARAAVGTILLANTFQLGLSFSEWIDERFTLGLGADLLVLLSTGEPPWRVGMVFPARVTWLLNQRPPQQVARRGLTLGLELAPGVDLSPRSVERAGGPLFTFVASLCVGWASW
ncbi:MAG: hypothetical protein ACOZQL_26415 [Myxococcota bacterium]